MQHNKFLYHLSVCRKYQRLQPPNDVLITYRVLSHQFIKYSLQVRFVRPDSFPEDGSVCRCCVFLLGAEMKWCSEKVYKSLSRFMSAVKVHFLSFGFILTVCCIIIIDFSFHPFFLFNIKTQKAAPNNPSLKKGWHCVAVFKSIKCVLASIMHL